jgi:hypothetical protein
MNMKVVSDGCYSRKERVYCMATSVVDDVVADSHPREGKWGWINTKNKVDKGGMVTPTNTN